MLNESAYQEGRRGCASSPVPKHLPLMRAGDRAGKSARTVPVECVPSGSHSAKSVGNLLAVTRRNSAGTVAVRATTLTKAGLSGCTGSRRPGPSTSLNFTIGGFTQGCMPLRWLGSMKAISEKRGISLIVPIPLGRKKRRSRGLTQAEILAEKLSGKLQVSLWTQTIW